MSLSYVNQYQKSGNAEKIIILGIDGMDHDVTKKLMAAGMLSNFKKLAESGTFLRLDTSTPAESPVAWMSMATGTNPGKHNMFDFIIRDPGSYIPRLALYDTKGGASGTKYINRVKEKTFWQVLNKENIETITIRWPVTFPPEEEEGMLLAGLGVPDIRGFLSGFTLFTERGTTADKGTIINVKRDGEKIRTYLPGPKMRKGGEVVSAQIPLEITFHNQKTNLEIDGVVHEIKEKEWSGWMRGSFKLGFLKKIPATFKVYLTSRNPFEMYVTSLQIDPQNPYLSFTNPKSLSSDLAGKMNSLYYTLGMPEETDGYVSEVIDKEAFVAQADEIEDEREKMFWQMFSEFKGMKKGVFSLVFDTSDRLQHVFWEQKDLSPGNKFKMSKVLLDYYQRKDLFLGELMEKMDEGTILLVVSDHGISSFERAVNLNKWLVDEGLMVLTEELAGRENPLFTNVDWGKTKAYALGFSSIYINLKGRESQGIVTDKDKVAREIVEKLENLQDPKTGKKVVHKVYLKEEIYEGEFTKDAPDLVVGFMPGYRMSWQTAVGGFGVTVLEDNTKRWKGDHLIDASFVPGVLFSNLVLDKEKASLLDIAPTVLEIMQVEIPEEIDGESLLE